FDRNPIGNSDAQNYTLEKITYPTGGYTKYEYEPNSYLDYKDGSLGSMQQKYAGIRLKKETTYTQESDTYIYREFKYGPNENGLGSVFYDIALSANFMMEGVYGLGQTAGGQMSMGRQLTFNSKPVGEIGSEINTNAPVTYPKVTEYHYGKV